jgi:Tfp pilus assembly protein PilF
MLKAGMVEHPDRLRVLNNLASIFTDTGRLSEAEALLRNCALEDKLLKSKEDESKIISKVNLSSVYFRMGNYTKAEELLLRCYEDNCRLRGHEHPYTAAIQANMAELYKAMGNHDKAEWSYTCCLEVPPRSGKMTPLSIANLGA